MVSEFLLQGLTSSWEIQILLFLLFTVFYIASMLGNLLIVLTILSDHHLHSPMYFLLANLSFIDTGVSSIATPKMISDLFRRHKVISLRGCITQMFFIHTVGGAEMVLLTVMAYDRYVAICKPLHYPTIMSLRMCTSLLAVAWTIGLIHSVAQLAFVVNLPFCGPNEINHISCETPAVLELACADTFLFEICAFTGTILTVIVPFLLILLSYVRILFAILKMPSTTGRQKSFSTCASHLTSVTLFYGTASMTYLQPKSGYSPETKKLMSLAYMLLTPLLNPLIYSLRNSEMKRVLLKVWRRKVDLHAF